KAMTSWPRRASARAQASPSRPAPTTTTSASMLLPAAGAPFGDVRALGAERGVLAVAGVDPGAVGQLAEHPLLEVVHELAEPLRVLLGVAGAAGEQGVSGEQVRLVGQRAARVVAQRDAARGVAAQVDDGQLTVPPADLVAVPDQ